jgi:hypothetical protein
MKKLKSVKGIPLKYIQSILKIDPLSPSGITWIPRTNTLNNWNAKNDWNAKYANNHAGCIHTDAKTGYQRWVITICYNGKKLSLLCSRIVFLLNKGYLTKDKCIDHEDSNPLNNNPDNLRESTIGQNARNSKLRKNNTSGHKGVHWHKASGKWYVAIKLNGKTHYFGTYINKEDAIKVAIAARKKLHGDFGRDQ